MNNETKKTEQLIQIYKEDPVKENLRALLHQMKKTIFYVPAMLPNTPEAEELRKIAKENPGKPAQLPKGMNPMPTVLKNSEGEAYLPIFTNPAQFPKESKFDLIMNAPFQVCYTIALQESSGMVGIALNPFEENILFKKEILEIIRKEDQMIAAGGKQVQVTVDQFKVMMRQKAEFHDLPEAVFQEGAEFVHKLCDEQETLLNEIFKNAYQKPELYPYAEGDFSMMSLNISEDLLLLRIDLPKIKERALLCHRIYITLNPKNDKLHYFTIEESKEKGVLNLGGVNAELKHIEYAQAPAEGAEIQRIMDIIEQEKKQTSETM